MSDCCSNKQESANPVIACYCMNVTKEMIVDAVIRHGASTLLEIQELTGANTGKDCHTKNPAGRCCAADVKKIIEEAVALRNKEFIKQEQ